jgi:hypothetical protein
MKYAQEAGFVADDHVISVACSSSGIRCTCLVFTSITIGITANQEFFFILMLL